MYICVYISYIYIYVHVYTQYMYVHMCIYIERYIHRCVYIYIYTHTHHIISNRPMEGGAARGILQIGHGNLWCST